MELIKENQYDSTHHNSMLVHRMGQKKYLEITGKVREFQNQKLVDTLWEIAIKPGQIFYIMTWRRGDRKMSMFDDSQNENPNVCMWKISFVFDFDTSEIQ